MLVQNLDGRPFRACASACQRMITERDAADLDVHLQGGDARFGARDLEVHVAVVVLGARDVEIEDRPLAGRLVQHEAHRRAGDRRAEQHAGIHHRQGAAADRGHRRRSVRLRGCRTRCARYVEELLFGRHHRHERPLRERAVADLAPAGAAQELHFADRERREGVVQDEALVGLAFDRFDLLRVVVGAERGGDERLGLAAREDGRAVGAAAARWSRSRSAESRQTFARPSRRWPRSRISSRVTFSLSSLKMYFASARFSSSVSGIVAMSAVRA